MSMVEKTWQIAGPCMRPSFAKAPQPELPYEPPPEGVWLDPKLPVTDDTRAEPKNFLKIHHLGPVLMYGS